MTPTTEMRRAVAAKDWEWARDIALERMRGSHARNWLRKIERLRSEHEKFCTGCNQRVDPNWTYCPYCGAQGRSAARAI